MKNIGRRLEKLESRLAAMPQRDVAVECTGLDRSEILRRIKAAMMPESHSVLEEINDQIATGSASPPRRLVDGTVAAYEHGFLTWMGGLRQGWSHLPRKIPHELFVAWRDLAPANKPLQRCTSCRTALPANYKQAFIMCPVCGCTEIWWMDLSKLEVSFRPRGRRRDMGEAPE